MVTASDAIWPARQRGSARTLWRTIAGLLIAAAAWHGPALARAGQIDGAARALPSQPMPFVDCRGVRSTRPTIILEAGAYGTSADWAQIEKALAKDGRVCAYDRLGLGASPDRATVPTAETIARDLAVLLDRLGENGPVVIIGHSNGALYAEAFASLFPERTTGLGYVDGVGTDDLDNPLTLSAITGEERLADVAVVVQRMGLAKLVVGRIVDAFGLQGQAARRKRHALLSARHLENARQEVRQILPSLAQIRADGPPPDSIPVAAIVAADAPDGPLAKAWRAAQVAPAHRACRGWVLDAVGASHVSPLGRDRAYVLAAARWLEREAIERQAQASPAMTCTPARYRS